ncbi:uncharacterized protein LODBEIA_P02510 [Lodderomyces beijingensis]|uniref:Protein CMS1 n=1 Tax=Lodderomyces beijingensis TaxID=1775926 RepID=A0ABP0ZCX6_9ASCO
MAPEAKVQPEADDLDDGLEYEVYNSAGEDGGEEEGETNGVDVSDEGDCEQEGDKDKEENESKNSAAGQNESRKRKKSDSTFKEKKRLKMEIDTENKKNISLEDNPEVITEFINSKITRKHSDLTALELSELYFTKSDIRTTAEFKKPRTLDNLGDYINQRFKNMLPGKQSKSKKNSKGSEEKQQVENAKRAGEEADAGMDRKFIAIVSMSAIRACDVHRATKDLNGGSLKLINKNKLHVDLKLVATTRSRILCCTPGRLVKLLNDKDSKLRSDEIKIVLVDNSYLDQKKQNVWDIKETVEALKELTKNGSKIYLY